MGKSRLYRSAVLIICAALICGCSSSLSAGSSAASTGTTAADASTENSLKESDLVGTYLGVQGSGLVLHGDGSAEYYTNMLDVDIDRDDTWELSGNRLMIDIKMLSCTIYADIENGDVSSFVLKSDSIYWDDEAFNKYSDEDTSLSKGEFDALLGSDEPEGSAQASTEEPNADTTTVDESEYYTTNSKEFAKNGNSGVYAYIKKGQEFDQYYVIDFDNGYISKFNYGNGDESGDRAVISSGTLNDTLVATFFLDGDTFSYRFCYKYKDHPETLVVEDNDGFTDELKPTDLDDALKIMDTFTFASE